MKPIEQQGASVMSHPSGMCMRVVPQHSIAWGRPSLLLPPLPNRAFLASPLYLKH